jgi:hypothetical protein
VSAFLPIWRFLFRGSVRSGERGSGSVRKTRRREAIGEGFLAGKCVRCDSCHAVPVAPAAASPATARFAAGATGSGISQLLTARLPSDLNVRDGGQSRENSQPSGLRIRERCCGPQ